MRRMPLPFLIYLAATATAFAQSRAPSDLGNTGNLGADASFMKQLRAADLAEADAGRLASEKATAPAVRQFGEQMLRQHTRNAAELETLAKTHGVIVSSTIDGNHAASKAKLEEANPGAFDSLYIKEQVTEHEKAVQLLQHEIDSGREGEVREFAQKTLPVAQHHLSMARELDAQLSRSAAQSSSR